MKRHHLIQLASFCFLALALLPGCVPVTAPLSDPDKAEPDKRLVCTWRKDAMTVWTIDAPSVKGNPKGLMHAVLNDKPDDLNNAFWFFTTTIGTHTYATICIERDGKQFADFRKEGAFANWNKAGSPCFIFCYKLDGDKLTVDGGEDSEWTKLMKAENLISEKIADLEYSRTPPGWLAKYLEKNGPQAIFNGKNVEEYQRVKK
jgi:hypothetical protein